MTTNIATIETPWGRSEYQDTVAEGIVFHSSASHGGYHLSEERAAEFYKRFPDFRTFCGRPEWFEEDCDACVIVLAIPESFGESAVDRARSLLQYLADKGRYDYFLQVLEAEEAELIKSGEECECEICRLCKALDVDPNEHEHDPVCEDCDTPLDEFGCCPKCYYS